MEDKQKIAALHKALEPFVRVVRIQPPGSDAWPDDKPPRDFVPGIWPDWGEFKRARDAFEATGGSY